MVPGARLEFIPRSNFTSSGSSSGSSDDGTSSFDQPGFVHSDLQTTPLQNVPVTGTESHSSSSSSSRDLERQLTRIKFRFKDPANTTTSASNSGRDRRRGEWTEAELDTLPSFMNPSPFTSTRNVQWSSPVQAPPSFSVSFPFHPRTQLGTHVWDHHRHSSIAVTYTVEDQGAGSYALHIRSVSVQWAWLSRKVTGTRATVPGFPELPARRPSGLTSPSQSTTSPTSFPQSRLPVLPVYETSHDELIRDEELSPPRPPLGPFPHSTASDPLSHPRALPDSARQNSTTSSTSTTSIGVSSSPSHSSADDSSSLLYSTDTGSELWDSSDNEE